MKDRAATYLYCLLRRDEAPPLSRAPKGLAGASRLRALDAGGGLWLIAADAPLASYGEEPIERGLRDLRWVSSCALPHEAVIEHFGELGTVLPMKLFTLFKTDERALAHIARKRRAIDRLLFRLEGRDEWGVRLTLDETGVVRRARESVRAKAPRGSGGTAFLLRKKKEQDLARELHEGARERGGEVFEALSAKADDARRRPPPPGPAGRRVLLDAAFLVRRGRVKAFQRAARNAASRLADEGYELTLTGPWPP